MAQQAEMKLAAFLMRHGHHVAAWRHPDVNLHTDPFTVFRQLTQKAESAFLDAVFFADSLALTAGVDGLEPLTLLSALAASTEKIGLIGTATTTYNEPYHVARKFASLDSISKGRAGWNLVTSDNAAEAANFGLIQHVPHAQRYERAREFYDVVNGLWRSWDQDALATSAAHSEGAVDSAGALADEQARKQSGRLFDPTKLHTLHHQGPHFSVRGPLNVAPSRQGKPVVVQAGGSEAGRELAAATADVVFTAHPAIASAKAFYQDVKGRLSKYGRSYDELKIMPGLFAVIGRSEAEAEDKFSQLQDLVLPEVGLALLGRMIGNFDLSAYPLDGPLPDLPITEDGQRSRQQLITDLAQGQQLSIRQLYLRIAGGRGHFTAIGTPESVVDQMQDWFEQGAADGFNFMPPLLPTGLDDFVNLVVPELQRRGLFRTAYQGNTLREHLGLSAG